MLSNRGVSRLPECLPPHGSWSKFALDWMADSHGQELKMGGTRQFITCRVLFLISGYWFSMGICVGGYTNLWYVWPATFGFPMVSSPIPKEFIAQWGAQPHGLTMRHGSRITRVEAGPSSIRLGCVPWGLGTPQKGFEQRKTGLKWENSPRNGDLGEQRSRSLRWF